MKNDEAHPQRKVHQPTNGGPRHPLRLLPGAPTFQEYVDNSDKYQNTLLQPKLLPIPYLRDEYISTWGTN